MDYCKLGSTGAYVSKLCLGTMNFGMLTDEKESFRMMDCAVDSGISFFDTSNSYGGYSSRGLTETILGKWFNTTHKREKIFLADKVFHLSEEIFGNPNDHKGLSAYKIRYHLEDSLRRLQTDHIELYQMHHIDRSVGWEEIWGEMNRLYNKGDIVYVGSSNFSAYDIADCNGWAKRNGQLGLVSEQHRYNLMCRLPELEVIPACRRSNVALLIWGPLNEGRLSDHPYATNSGTRGSHNVFSSLEKKRVDMYQQFCKEEGLDPSQVAIAWLLKNPDVTSVIIGPRNIDQLYSCLQATELNVEVYKEVLDEIFPGVGGEAPEVYAW